MESGDACLLDSNILLRISKSDDPQHAAISHALHELVGQGVRLCYTSQTLAEFWNASTRPLDKNGCGFRKCWPVNSRNSGTICRGRQVLLAI